MAVEEQDGEMKMNDRSATPQRKDEMRLRLRLLEGVNRSCMTFLAIAFINQDLFKISAKSSIYPPSPDLPSHRELSGRRLGVNKKEK